MPVRKVAAGQVEGNSRGGQFATADSAREGAGQVLVQDAFPMEGYCNECGGEMVVDTDGTSTHLDETGNDDFEANGDHVPYLDEQGDSFNPDARPGADGVTHWGAGIEQHPLPTEDDIPTGLKGGIDAPRFTWVDPDSEPECHQLAIRASRGARLTPDGWALSDNGHTALVPSVGTSAQDSVLAALASARSVEVTWDSGEWGDDDDWADQVRAARGLRDVVGRTEYERAVCLGQTSTV